MTKKNLKAPLARVMAVIIAFYATGLSAAVRSSSGASNNPMDVRSGSGSSVVSGVLRGVEAAGEVSKLQQTGKLARAAAALHARGMRASDHAVHLDLRELASKRSDGAEVAPDSVTMVSFDDGDDSTWEGIIHVEQGSSGRWVSLIAQLNPATREVTFGKVIERGDRNGSRPSRDDSARFGPAQSLGDDDAGDETMEVIKGWVACMASGCATAAAACWWSGPGWPECTSAWCAGAVVGCTVGAIILLCFFGW